MHAQDISQALYLMGLWLAQNPRDVVLKEAGVELEFPFSPAPEGKSTFNSIFHGKDKKNKRPSSLTDTWKTIPTVLPEGERPRIPLFNVTDDSDSTQESLAKLIAQLWDIKIGFLNSTVVSLVEKFSKVDFNEMIEDVNEKHVEAWSQMLLNCDPPIHSTPLSPYLDPHSFRSEYQCRSRKSPVSAARCLGVSPWDVHPEDHAEHVCQRLDPCGTIASLSHEAIGPLPPARRSKTAMPYTLKARTILAAAEFPVRSPDVGELSRL